jgi:hypothetical protein
MPGGGGGVASRGVPLSQSTAHPFRSRSLRRRSANRTDTGCSAYAAGTGQSAPKPSFPSAAHRLSWVLDHFLNRFTVVSFDDLVCLGKHQWWHGEAERLGGLQVEDQLELGGLLHG